MGFIGDIYGGVAGVVKKGADSVQTSVEIAEQERIIKRMSTEIGNLVLIELDKGRDFGPAIMERYDAILQARKLIEESKADKEPVKKVCPICGKANGVEMKYCGYCGADMDIIPEPEAEGEASDEEPGDTEE